MRENREIPRLPGPVDHRLGRPGKAKAVILGCTDVGGLTAP
jgi:hypothetical protein